MLKKIGIILLFLLIASCAHENAPQESTFANLGDVYAQAGQAGEAEKYYQRAHAMEPQKIDVMMKLANTQVAQEKFSDAKHTYRQILAIEPHHRIARFDYARMLMAQGDVGEALPQYQLLLISNAHDFRALNGLGIALDNLSRYKIAQSCYRKGLRDAPHNVALLNNLGVSYALSGEMSQAKQTLLRSSQLAETSRPKENLDLITRENNEIKNPVKRQKVLAEAMLLKTKNITSTSLPRAVMLAKQYCRP